MKASENVLIDLNQALTNDQPKNKPKGPRGQQISTLVVFLYCCFSNR